MLAAGLRLWAVTVDVGEAALTGAAVELAIRAYGGRFADPGWPWIVEGDDLGVFCLDVVAMTGWGERYGEHPVMAIVEALAGGRPARCVYRSCWPGWTDRRSPWSWQRFGRRLGVAGMWRCTRSAAIRNGWPAGPRPARAIGGRSTSSTSRLPRCTPTRPPRSQQVR